MAMKFWFGKKDVEQSGPGEVSCDVLTIPDHVKKGVKEDSPLFIPPKQGDTVGGARPVLPSGAAAPEAKTPAVTVGAEEVKEAKAPVGASAPASALSGQVKDAKPAVVEKEAEGKTPPSVNPVLSVGSETKEKASAAPGGAGEKTVGQPQSTPLRVAPVGGAGGEASVLAPVVPVARAGASAVLSGVTPVTARAATAAQAGVAVRPVFGFRPKAPGTPGSVSQTPATPPAEGQPAEAKSEGRREGDGVTVRPKTDQRALYYELMNGLYDAVLILDDQGHVVDCNTRITAVLGYTREEAWDLPIEKVITGMTSQMFEHLRRNLAESHHVLIDARCFRQDGTSFSGEVGVSTLSLTRGSNSNMVFAIRNVERRKTAMEELRKGQEALKIALAPTFVCDPEGFFLIVNQALLEAFGIPDETQAKSVRFVDLLPDAARFFLRASCGEKLRESLQIPTPDSAPVKIELTLSPIQVGETVTAVAGSMLQV